ncbi:MAG: DUF1444 family protein [Planctomycetota bacterium]|nr:MAG: DUF1444 family protein [Planctomycetota bacterium]
MSMASMPREPEAFAERVVEMLRALHASLRVELTGPSEAIVEGRRLDLENLYRLVAHAPESGVEIVEEFLRNLFATDVSGADAIPFEVAKRILMPRIHNERIFERLSREMVAHSPYVNDAVILYVLDLPQMTVSVTTEQVLRWGSTIEEIDEIARRNLAQATPALEPALAQTDEGGAAAVVALRDGYDASRLLLESLYNELAPLLGGDFLVATPARDTLIAVSRGPDEFVERIHEKVERDYRRLPYPITPDYFYVTRDGVAGTREAA